MKVSWDFEMRNDTVVPARRPGVVAIDKTKRTTTMIDVAAPLDLKLQDEEDKKILK